MNARTLFFLSGFVGCIFIHPLYADPYQKGHNAAINYNYINAIQHWGPLADEGYAHAQFNIALMYHGGLGVPLNEQEAVKWYHKAAEGGYTMAQEYLAAAYAEGWFGLVQDLEKAQYWTNIIESNQFNSANQ